MTTQELIEKLKQFPPENQIFIWNGEALAALEDVGADDDNNPVFYFEE